MADVLPGSVVASCTPDDVPELLVLQRCCWVSEAVDNDTLDIPPLHETADDIAEWSSAWTTLLVRRGHRLVAAVRGRWAGTTWEIGRLMVAPDLAGHGVGTALLDVIESVAPGNAERFVLFTGARSHRNIALYQRAGYSLAAPTPDVTPGLRVATVPLTKTRPR